MKFSMLNIICKYVNINTMQMIVGTLMPKKISVTNISEQFLLVPKLLNKL